MPIIETAPSRAALWTGRVMSAVVILFLIFDAVIKLIPIAPVIVSMAELGYPATTGIARGLGVITLACALLYAWPRSAVLGAILMTGLLGGAIATHLRIGSPIFTTSPEAITVLNSTTGSAHQSGRS